MKSSHLITLLLVISSSQVWAYGSDSSTKACVKPKFSHFQPVNNSEVAANSTFTFIASPQTNPETLEVTVKGQPVELTITEKNKNFYVSGTLPVSISHDFVRINIAAESPSKCRGADGWLLKVN